ncbi:cell wall hydrolase [Halanaerobiaceae bacterium Z-7014]|uniref:Cell wall hydrolase n=1 Tax=Halonatronomonas betaini TaxID=2778430 RepID=A0A931AUC5_9FIRM|nr:cell wall hydrolase [Halonatronomonas betaini]MBF8436655.1 cell wall hydrolase [Halonatronomonas betaini]
MNISKFNLKVIISVFILVFIFGAIFPLETSAIDFKLIYTVQEGDSLYEISMGYNISIDRLTSWNGLSGNGMIRSGDDLEIPLDDDEPVERDFNKNFLDSEDDLNLATEKSYPINVNANAQADIDDISEEDLVTYNVSSGDSLYEIARTYNTSSSVIIALNDLENHSIRPGDQLQVPAKDLTERQLLARSISNQEIELLARAINGEARGEPYLGQVAVGAVIINRVISDKFPDTIEGVIMQDGQFCAVEDGQIDLAPSPSTRQAAQEAVNGRDPTDRSLYFYNPETSNEQAWMARRDVIVRIGNHVFAR